MTDGPASVVAHCWRSVLLGLGICLALAGCTERDQILPGIREPIEAVLDGTEQRSVLPSLSENEAREIRLPEQTVNAAAAQFEGTVAFRTPHPALAGQLTRVWSVNIGKGDGRKERITADPVVAGGLVYTLDAETRVTAVSPDGQIVWQRDILPASANPGEATGGGLSFANGRLYVSSGYGVLVAMDASDGSIIWRQELDATGSGRPLVLDDLVYITVGDDTGWAIRTDSGRIAWRVGAAESVANVLGAPSPILVDDLVVFSFGSGEIQAVFRQGGLRRWDSSVLGERRGRALSKIDDVTGTPVQSGDVIYAGSQAGRTIAMNAASGARVWTTREGAISPVLPAGGSVFMISDRNELLRLDASDGSRVWGVALANFVRNRPRKAGEVFAHHGPVLAGGYLYVASGDGALRAYDPVDGGLRASYEIPKGATTRPVVAGQTLYVVGRNGQLHAFR